MIASYFFDNDVPMDNKTALALAFGIRSDTAKLSRGVSQLDMDMLNKLFPLCDKDVIYYLENSELEFSDLQAYAKATESIQLYDGNVAFSFAGENCQEALVASVISAALRTYSGISSAAAGAGALPRTHPAGAKTLWPGWS